MKNLPYSLPLCLSPARLWNKMSACVCVCVFVCMRVYVKLGFFTSVRLSVCVFACVSLCLCHTLLHSAACADGRTRTVFTWLTACLVAAEPLLLPSRLQCELAALGTAASAHGSLSLPLNWSSSFWLGQAWEGSPATDDGRRAMVACARAQCGIAVFNNSQCGWCEPAGHTFPLLPLQPRLVQW